MDDEDRILTDALGAAGSLGGGSGGRAGARFMAKRLRKNVLDLPLTLPAPPDAVAVHVTELLAGLGNLLHTGSPTAPEAPRTLRAVVGGGFGGLNPVVVTVTLSAAGRPGEGTAVSVRGAAKEGLIKQRAGEKTARQVASELVRRVS